MTLKRHPKKDPITPELRATVIRRDGERCVGPILARIAGVEFPGPCRSKFGADMEGRFGYLVDELQIDHVTTDDGPRRQTVERWLQALCPRCHLDGFATRKDIREAARVRLAQLYGDEDPDAVTDY
jgi:5-methylcytosine-specific restriction endonuclease McrA